MPHLFPALTSRVVLAFTTCLLAAQVHAAPVSVVISDFSFEWGSGYGVDGPQGQETLLDVLFTRDFSAQSFSLNEVGDSHSFQVGTINLREPNVIGPRETDDLWVRGKFTFTSPFGDSVTVSASGIAVQGDIDNDAHVDLKIDWEPFIRPFNGGVLEIALADVQFTRTGSLEQLATVTRRAPPADPNSVPEPGSLALAGLALLGLATARRRRA